MSDPYISQIEAFAFGFAPRNWMPCAGQLLPIAQYQALFALLGTTYGGDGVRTFQLPDLRSRLAIGFGQGQGLPNYALGQQTGQETVTLLMVNMPAGPHTHSLNANNATSGGTNQPSSSVALSSCYSQPGTAAPTPINLYGTVVPNVPMGALAATGGQPHGNLAPILAINYCICISGIFPSRG